MIERISPVLAGAAMDECVRLLSGTGILLCEAERQFRKRWIEAALKLHHGNQKHAAPSLGMHRNTLSRAIAQLHIDALQFKTGGRIYGPRYRQSETARAARVAGGRRGAAATNYASKERSARGVQAAASSALAPVSGGPPPVFGEEGGRGDSSEPSRGGVAHLAQDRKPPCVESLNLDVECGGLKA